MEIFTREPRGIDKVVTPPQLKIKLVESNLTTVNILTFNTTQADTIELFSIIFYFFIRRRKRKSCMLWAGQVMMLVCNSSLRSPGHCVQINYMASGP